MERDLPRAMARTDFDAFTSMGCSLAVAGTIVADVLLSDAVLAKWLRGEVATHACGPFVTNVQPKERSSHSDRGSSGALTTHIFI